MTSLTPPPEDAKAVVGVRRQPDFLLGLLAKLVISQRRDPVSEQLARETDGHALLSESIASLSATIDKANLRLDLTREALRALIDNEFAYMHLLAAIEVAVDEGRPLAEAVRELRECLGDG